MKINTLKRIRVISAVLVFTPIFLFFCDFANLLPLQLHGILHIQIIPAIMMGSIPPLIFLTILSLLFGRIYCSVICPLGVFQDIIAWFTRRGKKNKKRRRYKYAKPLPIVRYSILFICIVFLIFGITIPLLYLDPYSNFGRMAVNLFRPLLMEGNNLLNWFALKLHIYHFYYITVSTVTVWSLAISVTILLIVGIMALLRGRLYCNSLCPVGALLGLISRFSLFRIELNDSRCTSCGLCEHACKSQCINSKEKNVDRSRCVSCFNCLNRCKSDGVNYRFALGRSSQPERAAAKEKNAPEITNRTNIIGMSRRSFLAASTAIAATLPVIPALAKTKKAINPVDLPITPPGSISLEHFKKKCTACHLCITHCPQQILKPAGFDFGFGYAFKPHMVFYVKAYCNYECTACTEVCPNGAIRRLTKEEKKITQVGIARFRRGRCIVHSEHTACGACSEHCPTQAVKMEPYIDHLTLPHVYEELCIGCGGCESICPVHPKAIYVIANEVHQTAEKPPEGEMLDIDLEELNFGF